MHVSHAYFLSLTRTMFVDDIGKGKKIQGVVPSRTKWWYFTARDVKV
jgi:hypothetical protein